MVISILDDAFSYARYNNAAHLEIRFIVKVVNICNRIYKSERDRCIDKLISLNLNRNIVKTNECKILSLKELKK